MRRLVVVGIAVLMAFSLTACGGGDEAPEGEVAVQTQGAAVPAPAGAAVQSEASSNTLSPQEPSEFEPFPTDPEALPADIKQRLDAKRPMLQYFYDPTQKTTDDQRAEIDSVLSEYRGLIDLVAYDVSKYVSTDASGVVSPLPGMADDVTAQQVARLLGSDYLDASFTPYIVFVDRQGYITFRFRGFVDSALLEREVLRATE